jgi:hypothetical protein
MTETHIDKFHIQLHNRKQWFKLAWLSFLNGITNRNDDSVLLQGKDLRLVNAVSLAGNLESGVKVSD